MTPDSKAAVLRAVEGAAERYSSNLVARTALAAVPILGGALDAALSTIGANAFQERIESLAGAIAAECRMLEDSALRKDFLRTEEWLQVVQRAVEATARTKDREKIRQYARILVHSATKEDRSIPEAGALIATLTELLPIEIEIARIICGNGEGVRWDQPEAPHRISVVPGWWEKVVRKFPTEATPNLVFHLKRLERAGMIAELTGTYSGGTAYGPTTTLGRLVAILSEMPVDRGDAETVQSG
jgi:hypothetical protein